MLDGTAAADVISFVVAVVAAVPTGSPSSGGDVTVYVCDINQPSLPTLFYSFLYLFLYL